MTHSPVETKKNIILLRSCYSSLFQFDRDCSIFLYFIVCSGFRLQRYRNNHSVSLTTSRDGKLYTSQWRSSATSSKRVYRLPDNLKIVGFTDRSKIKKKENTELFPRRISSRINICNMDFHGDILNKTNNEWFKRQTIWILASTSPRKRSSVSDSWKKSEFPD